MTYLIYGTDSVIKNDIGLQVDRGSAAVRGAADAVAVQFRGLDRRVHYGN